MKKKLLISILVCYFLVVPLGSILGHYGFKEAFELFKVVFVSFTLAGLIPFAKEVAKGAVSDITIVLILGFLYALFNGVINNNVGGSIFVSHLYTGLMPILMISYGRSAFDFYSGRVVEIFYVLNKLIYPLFIIVGCYFIAYQMGYISYFGVSTQAAFMAIYFSLLNNKLGTVFSILVILLSGKRGALLTLVAGGGFISLKKVLREPVKFFPRVLLFTIVALAIIWIIAVNTSLLSRFSHILEIDVSSEHSLFMATGGRSLEVLCVAEHIQAERIFFTGGGFGESFILRHNLRTDTDSSIKGFSHFSPISLTLVYGLPYAVVLYLFLFLYVYRNKDRILLSAFLFMGLVSSIGGSVLMYDPFFWFVVGLATKGYKV